VLTTRNYLLALATLVSLAIIYYFAYALPKQNRLKLDIERQKIESEQLQRDEDQSRSAAQTIYEQHLKKERAESLITCRNEAIDRANFFLEQNGKPVYGQPEVYSAPQYIHDKVTEIRRIGIDECVKLYGD